MSSQTETLIIDDAAVHYQKAGAGNALVLIHAGIADMRMWDDQIDGFAEFYQVIRFDVRGYGLSPNPAGTYQDHEILRKLLDHLGIVQTVLIGCSMGGNIAVDFTLAYPERVIALITVGSGLEGFEGSDQAEIKQSWSELEIPYEAGDMDTCADIILGMWCEGPRRTSEQVDSQVRARARDMALHMLAIPEASDLGEAEPLQPRALERLGEIRVPTLAIVGDQDYANQIEFAHYMAEHVSDAELVIMEDVAHLPNMEKAVEFNQSVLGWLVA
ncbi:MAG: alpha/beta fold hydrolase [Chloroflexi bacterium]|nr:alpha/beta fold hydrolase [Chloroflexota bacterium]